MTVRADSELRAGEERMRDGLRAGQTHGFAYSHRSAVICKASSSRELKQ